MGKDDNVVPPNILDDRRVKKALKGSFMKQVRREMAEAEMLKSKLKLRERDMKK